MELASTTEQVFNCMWRRMRENTQFGKCMVSSKLMSFSSPGKQPDRFLPSGILLW